MDTEKLRSWQSWIRTELESSVNFWLKNGMDPEHGGIYTCLTREGKVFSTDKSVWMQGRCGWIFAHMCRLYGTRPEWLEASRSCLDFMEADKDGVILVYVITFGSDGRARGWVAHFDGSASLLVHPIQIGLGVWHFRLNLKNVCTDGIRQIFGNFCGDTAGRKVSDKSFAHGNALPLDDFV